jgi:hypothetical protein
MILESACLFTTIDMLIVIPNKEINRSFSFFKKKIIDVLQAQVEEIRGMLRTIIKGKAKEKEKDKEDFIIDWSELSINPKKTRNVSSQGYGQAGSSKSAAKYASGSSKGGATDPILLSDSDVRGRSQKRQPRLEKLRSRSRKRVSKDRPNRGRKGANRSPSPSPSPSPSKSPSSASQQNLWLFYDDIDKELKIVLRVTYILFI